VVVKNVLPTAHTSLLWSASIANRALLPTPGLALGLATILHEDPFQCSATVDVGLVVTAVRAMPTAHTSFFEIAATEARRLLPMVLGLGVGTLAQLEPSQCWLNTCRMPAAVVPPTAQISFAETAETPVKTLTPPGLGLAAIFHDELHALSVLWVNCAEGSEAAVEAGMAA
jgi:hypothetical protein